MAPPVRPKKHLGQHFLTDENIARKIASLVLQYPHISHWLEIGPGTGILTQHLIPSISHLTLCEIDRESISYLKSNLPQIPILEISFLDIPLLEIPHPTGIIGNFPYNISSQIVFHILDNRTNIPAMAGMFQKEMAQRIAAKHGGKDYGILSVLTQAFFEVKYHFTVNENVFYPPPKVKSGVITLTRKENHGVRFPERLKDWVKTSFNQRRKTIRNTLKSKIDPAFIHLPIFDLRPEAISVEDWIKFTNGDFFEEIKNNEHPDTSIC